jgi:hypothetical protein
MKKILTIRLSLILLLAETAMALDSNSDWRLLPSIPAGQEIVVKISSGKSLKGAFQRAADATLELTVDGKHVELQSTEISRVYVLRGRQTLKGTFIGMAVGTGAGTALGAIGCRHSEQGWEIISQGACTAMGAGLGLVVGSVTGLAIGVSRHKKELVYKAAKTP